VALVDQPRDLVLVALATWLRPMPFLYRYNRSKGQRTTGVVERWASTRLRGCLYQSRYVRTQALADEPRLASVPHWIVHNGFDADWFTPDPSSASAFRAHYAIPSDASIVLTVGALVAGKGHALGIAALARLSERGVNVVYLLAGDGPRRREVRRLAANAGVPLRDPGWLPASELREAYRAADVMLHPSEHEIFPNAVGEAMACGAPVVATGVGGTPELVGDDGRGGLLVPSGDVDAVAEAVGSLLREPARRAELGREARARIGREFPLARMVEGTEDALAAVARAAGLPARAGSLD
jgi:glycosyltransferase involved in cell wall biosynthesis